MQSTFRTGVLIALFALTFSEPSFAASLATVADHLEGPMEFLTMLMEIAAYVTGIALVVFSFVQYGQHRRSPKLVPLTTPIVMLVLGLVLIALPQATNLFGNSWSATARKERAAEISGGTPSNPYTRGSGSGNEVPAGVPVPERMLDIDEDNDNSERAYRRPAPSAGRPPERGYSPGNQYPEQPTRPQEDPDIFVDEEEDIGF